ncbi:MAG TPA: Na+/H+ antiporter NhaA [Actinomycetota bacterium]
MTDRTDASTDHGTDEGTERLRVPWSRSDRRLPRLVVRPLQSFLDTEEAGGVLLLLAAGAALLWANLWPGSYESVWHTDLILRLGSWELSDDLQHWINDGLMALFFFVVGLEIKRELVVGELRDPKTAAFPTVAALGGMIVPAAFYLALNAGGPGVHGWGIPMATDIAFAVGVLALLGRGLPSSLRVFLLSLAIVDDIGAILVIAIFYSSGISWAWLALAAGFLVLIAAAQRVYVRFTAVYLILGVGTWLAVYLSGVHATIAGVALGLLTPAMPFQMPGPVSERARRVADRTADTVEHADEDAHHWLGLARLSREAVSPLARIEHALHPWTSYVIIPLFALANAGVELGGGAIGEAATSRVTLGVILGLVAGKILGITLFSWGAVRLGLARLPSGSGWTQVTAVSAVAGIGFTVSLFIASLAFTDPEILAAAKVGILAASIVAGAIGAALLAMSRRRRAADREPVAEGGAAV